MIDQPYKTLPNNHKFYLLNPDPELVDIKYICSTLSRINRFGADVFYSVAQHSVNCYEFVKYYEPDNYTKQFAALIHDFSEAYVNDIISPQKEFLYFIVNKAVFSFKEVEDVIMSAIQQKIGIKSYDYKLIKNVDLVMGAEECRVLLPSRDYTVINKIEFKKIPSTCRFEQWSPQLASTELFTRYNQLIRKINGPNLQTVNTTSA